MLKEYTSAFGVSGCEGEIRDLIKSKLKGDFETYTDHIGNLIVHKKGKGKKVMVAAHMDEVGFIVTRICDDGGIKFSPVGGIDIRTLISKEVIFKRSKIRGVIGFKPIHMQDKSDRENAPSRKELFIDIGVDSKGEAEKYVKLGDFAVFESEYVDMGDCIKAKALDDRVGCAILTEILNEDYDFDFYGAFTVQEEVGLRGAGIAAYRIEPEIGIVLEGTTCADISKEEVDYVTTLGMGPAISLIDARSHGNGKLLKLIVETAQKNNIPYQFRRGKVGGNDAGRIHRTREGCLTATISVPTRYIHSPISMIKKKDYEDTLKLVKLVLRNIEGEVL